MELTAAKLPALLKPLDDETKKQDIILSCNTNLRKSNEVLHNEVEQLKTQREQHRTSLVEVRKKKVELNMENARSRGGTRSLLQTITGQKQAPIPKTPSLDAMTAKGRLQRQEGRLKEQGDIEAENRVLQTENAAENELHTENRKQVKHLMEFAKTYVETQENEVPIPSNDEDGDGPAKVDDSGVSDL